MEGPGTITPIAPLEERESIEQRVARTLRDLIVAGQLPSGTPLVQRDLAQQLGVSPTPVRAGLSQLEREGLVAVTATGRAVVSRLTREDFEEIYAARLGLEGSPRASAPSRSGAAEIARMKRAPAPPARARRRAGRGRVPPPALGVPRDVLPVRAAASGSSTRWSGCSGAPIATTASSSRRPSASASPSAATGSFSWPARHATAPRRRRPCRTSMRWAVDRLAATPALRGGRE